MRNQKRVLEEKLKALEAEQAASRQLVDSKPLLTNIPYQPQSRITNGYPTFSEQQQMSTAYSWSLPQQFSQPSFSSAAMATQPNLTSVGSQYFSERPVERIDMRVPEQNYPTPVPLLPREPVVSSLPKQYVPLSYRQQPEVLRHVPLEVTHKQQVDIQPQRPPEFANQIYPPKYASALSQIQSQRDSGSYGFMQPTSQSYLPPNMPPVSALGRVPTSSLSMSSLSSSSTEYYPQTFPAPSLPVPSTVGLMPTMYAPQHDQTKKIKDYQQYLLERHEQSKKVLADTRAEIERRRQELLQRFPQLASKSPESMETVSQLVSTTPVESSQEMHSAAGDIPPKIQPPVSQKGETTELSPSKAAISSLVSKLASDPYYALRLGIGQQEEEKKADPSKKFKDVRKSLPFDESLQESPFGQIHDSGGKLRKSHFDSTLDSEDGRRDLDDTVMSSSTDRGSPKLNGRKSGQMTDSDLDTSGQSAGRDQNEIYDRRQQELKKQLEEIQKQKEAILQRHDMAHLRLHAEQERLRYQMAEEEKQRRLTPDVTSEDSTTEIDTDEERGGDVLTTKHLRVPPQKQKLTLLSDHRPHELSTIQEVDTPRSAVRSVESARPSLSSSGSSVSRRSLDPYQLSTGTIPEEREPAQEYATPTNRRTAADSGYQTKQIEEILQRAREFDPSVVERLKRQTNDIFASVATPPQKGGTPGSNMSLSMGSLTPDSLSTGPISDSNVSTQYNSPSEAPAFKVVSQKGKNSSRSDSSYPSGMSWADELSNYSGQYHSMKMDDSSKTSADSKVESGFKVLKSSSQEKLDEDDIRPSKSPVDRKYDVFHMKTEQPSIRKSPVDSQRFKILDDSTTSEGSSKLNLQDLSAYTPSERSQGAPELSQYPLLSKSNTALEKSSSDDRSKGYSSSSAINESSARESPLGGTDTDNGDDNHLMKTAESLGSTATSASSYMDLDAVNGMNRPFDFIGQFKFSGRDQTASTSNSDLIELDSSKYSQKGGFTSTPYTTQDKLSEYALSPEESRIRSGTKQTFDSSSKYTPVFVSKSGDFRSSDSSAPSSGDKKIGATLSQYSIKSDTQGVTLIGKDLSQYSLESEDRSPLSQYSIETTENASPIKGGKSLSQYSLKDDSSLSQHSLDPSRQISGTSLPKGDKSMTQYSYSDDFTGETPQSTSHDHVDGPHSQYSLHSSQTSMTQGRLNESDIGVDLSSAPLDGTSISQHTLNSTNDEDQNMIDKKFANLDNLIKESRDLIAKHKQLITKNKEWDQKSEESTPERISQNRNANNKNLFEMAGQRLKPEMVISARTTSETSGSSFNVTDDVSPMMITASSADMTQDHLRTGDSLSMDVSSGIKIPGDSAMSRLSQLDTTAGISDEPDLTLVTESSDVSMNQEGQPTHHSEGASSNNNDSVWSFEQHEQSAMSSPDITENDFPDLPQDKDEEEDHSGLAGQTLQESFQRRQQSMSTVKRDAGEDVVFRAVPVVVSPTLSFSMKFNSNDLKPKAPLTWASELKSEKGPEKVSTTVETKQHFKAPELKKETKKETVSKTVDKPAAVVHKSKSTGNLNPALQPRSAESVSSAPSTGQKSATLGHSKSTGIISLGEFLKRQLSNEEEQPRPDTVVQNKNSAIVTTKHKPGPSINTKNVSPSKSTPSFYGKAKEADTTKTPSFSVGKKTGLGTSFNSKPGNSGKPAPSSHMSKTLSSWKKSRAVKSAGPPPPPKPSSEFPNGMKEFPKPVDRAGDDEAYARHMRLQNRLGIEEPEETSNEEKKKSPKSRETLEEKQKRAAANRDKVKEFQKKLQENIKKKQMQKKQES